MFFLMLGQHLRLHLNLSRSLFTKSCPGKKPWMRNLSDSGDDDNDNNFDDNDDDDDDDNSYDENNDDDNVDDHHYDGNDNSNHEIYEDNVNNYDKNDNDNNNDDGDENHGNGRGRLKQQFYDHISPRKSFFPFRENYFRQKLEQILHFQDKKLWLVILSRAKNFINIKKLDKKIKLSRLSTLFQQITNLKTSF